MRRAYLSAVCLLLLGADLPLPAQIGGPYPGGPYPGGPYPGGPYPGGGYPPGTYPGGGGMGIPFPRRNKQPKNNDKDNPVSTKEYEGMLRKLNDKSLILETGDHRIITIKRNEKTRFLKDGEEMKPSKFKPGDHLRVEASEDEQGYLYAQEVNFDKAGTAEERAAASEPVNVTDTGGDEGKPAEHRTSTSPGDDDPDRPVLRRRDPAPETADAAPPAQAAAPQTAPPQAAPAQPKADTKSPNTAPVSNQQSKSAPDQNPDAVPSLAQVLKGPEPAPAPRDPDDPGPPKLKYGKPAKQQTSDQPPVDSTPAAQPTQMASARPPDPNPTAPIANPPEPVETAAPPARAPQASQRRVDPVIEKARDRAGQFSETLPDYVVQEFMARFVNTAHTVNWQPQDVVSTEVVYEKGRERYRNVKVNNTPKKSIEETGGAWSTGEFASVLLDLFSPATDADFRYRHESVASGKASMVYDFDVQQPNSHWNVMAASQSYRPAYRGTVWIDKRTYRVLRIEMQAYHFPSDFPLDKVESATDYDYVRFGGEQQFLMPVHAETLSCQRGTNLCAMNKIDFRNYHKYAGESTITFGADAPQGDKAPKK